MLSRPSRTAVSEAAIVQGCHVGVIALGDPLDHFIYKDPIVDYDLRYDLDTPSLRVLEAVHFMHKASYTHVIIQQVTLRLCMLHALRALVRLS